MNERPLNVKNTVRTIWRHRLLVGVVAAACALGGVAYGVALPPSRSAVTLVFLAPGSTSNPQGSLGMRTYIALAESTPVLGKAGSAISPHISPVKLRDQLEVTSLSQQVVQIQASAKQPHEAEQLANAVTFSFMNYMKGLVAATAKGATSGLQHEAALLTQQIEALQTQIETVSARLATETAASTAGQRDTSLLTTLRSQQNQISLQLNDVNSQIVTVLSDGASLASIRELQRATLLPNSKSRLSVLGGIIGLLLGLLGSSIFVLLRSQRDPRLRMRREIASAIGAPVIASLESPDCKSPSEWQWLLTSQPSAAISWTLRRILHELPGGSEQTAPAVRVISFADDVDALSLGPQLALYSAASGTPTTLVIAASPVLTSLRAACSSPVLRDSNLPLAIASENNPHTIGARLVAVAVFDPRMPELHPFAGINILSISPGAAGTDDMARLGLAVADVGETLDGIIVVNPDPEDGTTGLTWGEVSYRNSYRVRHEGAIGPRPVRSSV